MVIVRYVDRGFFGTRSRHSDFVRDFSGTNNCARCRQLYIFPDVVQIDLRRLNDIQSVVLLLLISVVMIRGRVVLECVLVFRIGDRLLLQHRVDHRLDRHHRGPPRACSQRVAMGLIAVLQFNRVLTGTKFHQCHQGGTIISPREKWDKFTEFTDYGVDQIPKILSCSTPSP